MQSVVLPFLGLFFLSLATLALLGLLDRWRKKKSPKIQATSPDHTHMRSGTIDERTLTLEVVRGPRTTSILRTNLPPRDIQNLINQAYNRICSTGHYSNPGVQVLIETTYTQPQPDPPHPPASPKLPDQTKVELVVPEKPKVDRYHRKPVV